MSTTDAAETAHVARAEHFDDLEQQRESSTLGMWIFLATEVMFFGGLFTAYATFRHLFHDAFAASSNRLDIVAGGINTAVLLCSSWTMVLAIHAAHGRRAKATTVFLLVTMVLGACFLGIKGYEYHEKFVEHLVPGYDFTMSGQAQLFFYLYFLMTLIHAIHLAIGIVVLGVFAARFWRRRPKDLANPARLEIAGLYWHFVDIIWIFLFPLLYLVERTR